MSSDSSSSSGSSSDDSSDDELPQTAAPPSVQTGANVRHVVAGTYGTVVAVLDDGDVKVRWEGGDTSTLNAAAYAAAYAKALRSYAKSPRARGENDATSSSSDDDDDDDDADVDRPLEVGDKLLSRCGLVGTVEEISKNGVVIVQWGKLPKTASREPVRSLRRAAHKPVDYATAYSTDVDEPKPLSMDDSLAFRKLWLEKQEGGAVHATQDDDWDSSQGESQGTSQGASSQENLSQEASSQEDPSQEESVEWAPAKASSRVSRVSKSDVSDGPPARPAPRPSAPRPSAPRPSAATRPQPSSTVPRASPTKPLRPTEPPVSPLASQDEDEDEFVLPSQADPTEEPSRERVLPSQYTLGAGPAAVAVPDLDPDALYEQIVGATPSDRGLWLSPPPVRKLDRTDDRYRPTAAAARWRQQSTRDALKMLEYKGDLNGLDGPHLNVEQLVRDDFTLIIIDDRKAADDYQKGLEATYRTCDELKDRFGFRDERKSFVLLFAGVDGAPPEIVAVVAIGTEALRTAFVENGGVRHAEELVRGGQAYLYSSERGETSSRGWMAMFGLREPRFKNEDQKRKIGGGAGVYKHKNKEKVLKDAAYLRGASFMALFLSTFELLYTPERHVARVLLSDAINAPPICQGISRWRAAAATIAMSLGYACRLHTDRSGKTINETIVWPPLTDPPADWRFAIACAGILVDLTGPGGVFVTLSGYSTVHGTLESARRRDHKGMGFAAVLRELLIKVDTRDALAVGPKKKARV